MPKSYTVDDDYNDSRLDKWFKNKVINLPHSLLEKILRQNKIKVNKKKTKIDDQEIIEILTVNGIRFSFNDGSWGLIRASSNKPSLVIVTESPTSDLRKKKIFQFIDKLLQKTGKIGAYDQTID